MIIDTSALMAMILDEPDSSIFLNAYIGADQRTMSAGNWIELQAVLTRRGDPRLDERLRQLIDHGHLIIEPVTVDQAEIGRAAYRRYGRGTGHPAQLNFGDCFAYALSRATGESLLFKGADFTRTDVQAAL